MRARCSGPYERGDRALDLVGGLGVRIEPETEPHLPPSACRVVLDVDPEAFPPNRAKLRRAERERGPCPEIDHAVRAHDEGALDTDRAHAPREPPQMLAHHDAVELPSRPGKVDRLRGVSSRVFDRRDPALEDGIPGRGRV